MKFTRRAELCMPAGTGTGGGKGADGTGDGAAAFDPAKFQTDIMAGINTTLNGFAKSLKTDVLAAVTEIVKPKGTGEGTGTGTGEGTGTGTGEGTGTPASKDPAVNARFQGFEKEIKTLKDAYTTEKKAREAAENKQKETERVSAIRGAMTGIKFASPEAGEDFFSTVNGRVKYDDQGNIIAETDKGPMPVKDFVQAQVEAKPWFLEPSGRGGSGASSGTRTGGTAVPDISTMTPKQISELKPEQRAAAAAAISAVLTSANAA